MKAAAAADFSLAAAAALFFCLYADSRNKKSPPDTANRFAERNRHMLHRLLFHAPPVKPPCDPLQGRAAGAVPPQNSLRFAAALDCKRQQPEIQGREFL